MENSTFKSVAFGGFDKQDVIGYIERAAREHETAAAAWESEKQQLSGRVSSLEAAKAALETQAGEVREQLAAAQAELGQIRSELQSAREENETLQGRCAELDHLRAETESLRPDAESYRQFRTRIGEIECDAQRRSAELEAATVAKLEQITAAFRAQYQQLMTTFDATAGHVTGELRKVEVNLTQLPRAMDQSGAELKALQSMLEQAKAESARK